MSDEVSDNAKKVNQENFVAILIKFPKFDSITIDQKNIMCLQSKIICFISEFIRNKENERGIIADEVTYKCSSKEELLTCLTHVLKMHIQEDL